MRSWSYHAVALNHAKIPPSRIIPGLISCAGATTSAPGVISGYSFGWATFHKRFQLCHGILPRKLDMISCSIEAETLM